MFYGYFFAITAVHVHTFTNHDDLLRPIFSIIKIVTLSQHPRQVIWGYRLKYIIVVSLWLESLRKHGSWISNVLFGLRICFLGLSILLLKCNLR